MYEGTGGIQMDGSRDGYVIFSADERRIATLHPTSTSRYQRGIDADFIVRAVNAHDALLEASDRVDKAFAAWSEDEAYGGQLLDAVCDAVDALRAAIAQATGSEGAGS